MRARRAKQLALMAMIIPWCGSEASTIIVTSTADVISNDGLCSLREAIIASNTDTPSGTQPGECITGAGTDSILLQGSAYVLTIPGTGEDEAATGDLDLLDSVEILGAGQTDTVIDGNDLDRVFEVDNDSPDISVTILDLTIRDGATSTYGGGIRNRDVLELTRVTLVSNSAGSDGGAIYSSGELSLTECLVTLNSADSDGGGIDADFGSLTRSEVTFNTAGDDGGGVKNSGDMNITDSTIAYNTGEDGGGIEIGTFDALTLERSTVTGNIASDFGGGILNRGDVTIRNTTLSGNQAKTGGGLRNSQVVDIRNSTVFGNSAAAGSAFYNTDDIYVGNTIIAGTCASDPLLSFGGGIESPGDTCGLGQVSDQVSVTSQALSLGPLEDNGGYTLTHAPIHPSVAIDSGFNAICLATDQRGVERPQDGDNDGLADCDSGSVEYLTIEEEIFSDGFESGDTSAWSSTVP